MAHNVEIKAQLRDPDDLRARVEQLADQGPTVLEQEDVFFRSSAGRLKLRKFPDRAELIYYERPDSLEPVESEYMKVPVADAGAIEAVLSVAVGVRGTVRKRRELYLVGSTRVHVDEVEGLGSFLELEVVLEGPQTIIDGNEIARDLMEKLGVQQDDLVANAYIDLLEQPASAGG